MTKEEIEQFLKANPSLVVAFGALIFQYMVTPSKEGRSNTFEKHAGPWRGKGSFGHGFGANPVHHK